VQKQKGLFLPRERGQKNRKDIFARFSAGGNNVPYAYAPAVFKTA
jgi:hypothetical protein